jgi:glyoxylase-like metal-dependent hydrolase (beta-lactamase superfamily II)
VRRLARAGAVHLTTWVCKACGTQFAPSEKPPDACAICEDPRQYVPADEGQVWLRWDEVLDSHRAEIRDDHGILGIGCEPAFAIGQRALLVKSRAGNVLWDCTTYLDDAIGERIAAEGGLAAIAISHPHYYSAMVEWAHVFGCPVWLHEAERKWVMRPDPSIRFWEGGVHALGGGLTLVRCGGHFEGGQVLHWEERNVLLAGDIVQVIPDRRYVGFMYSYPNLIPLPAAKVQAVASALEPFAFEAIYGAWWDRVVEHDGSAVVRRSAERYVRAVTEPGLAS